MSQPVFYDPTGRRSRLSKRALFALLLLVALGSLAFATTLIAVPDGRDLALPVDRPLAAPLRFSHARHRLAALLPPIGHARGQAPLAVGFYMPGDDASFQSLRHHARHLDWVVPAMVTVSGPGHAVKVAQDPRFERFVAAQRIAALPMVQNLGEAGWDGEGIAALLRDSRQRKAVVAQLAAVVAGQTAGPAAERVSGQGGAAPAYKGLVLDFESLPASALPAYAGFVRQLRKALPPGAKLAVTVPAEEGWPLEALARAADKVVFMAYDEHWQGGMPGPIASQDWFVREVQKGLARIGPDRIVVALGSYAYDWHRSGVDALSVEDAWLAAHDSDAPIAFDPGISNSGFAYDEAGEHHTVWMLDAAASWNEMAALRRLGISDIALWRLGSEDPGFWKDLSALRRGGTPDLALLKSRGGTDIEGSGEILHIAATPRDGHRTVRFDARDMVREQRYDTLPTPYVVERAGAADPHRIALTFDDGPDAAWTPAILSEMEAARVPGTFFIIGENAVQHPELLRRIVADGGELGNHTYTHPNLANASARQTRLEVNVTQRLVQAYTGRSMTLFRAPYFGDAEPTTADELDPAQVAQKAGYTVVGLHVDPGDWTRPGTDAIVARVLAQVAAAGPDRSANVVLLHDGGGDRSQTVAALPRIIAALKARGYTFVTASQLVGISPAQAMPAISPADLAQVRFDVAAFFCLMALSAVIAWLFYLAISLGMARAVIITALAWYQNRRRRGEPPQYQPSVTVIIPAYNEERVIAASIARVLASDYPAVEVIVADDGSKDATSRIVAQAYGQDPRVRLLTLENGGKAAALNRALVHATGEIIIALDADTQFEEATIARLARWFADPRIGAVAGDARVGNRVNLVTRWQAVEYITAQNLERRALANFDAMTVVPGAVGAWRRAALDSVGGYPEDTLAEDQDLTIAIARQGWRVTYDPRAVAWTEAPESFRALAKQRFRWAFGTLQCLWKHRAVLVRGRPVGLARVGLPQAWLFQIVFAAISPLIDFALVLSLLGTALRVEAHGWDQTRGDVGTMALYWLAFTALDVACGWVAYRLDGRRERYPALLLLSQRLVYRQIMYAVVLRAIASAVAGWGVGWGKLARTGRVSAQVPPAPASTPPAPSTPA